MGLETSPLIFPLHVELICQTGKRHPDSETYENTTCLDIPDGEFTWDQDLKPDRNSFNNFLAQLREACFERETPEFEAAGFGAFDFLRCETERYIVRNSDSQRPYYDEITLGSWFRIVTMLASPEYRKECQPISFYVRRTLFPDPPATARLEELPCWASRQNEQQPDQPSEGSPSEPEAGPTTNGPEQQSTQQSGTPPPEPEEATPTPSELAPSEHDDSNRSRPSSPPPRDHMRERYQRRQDAIAQARGTNTRDRPLTRREKKKNRRSNYPRMTAPSVPRGPYPSPPRTPTPPPRRTTSTSTTPASTTSTPTTPPQEPAPYRYTPLERYLGRRIFFD